MKMEQTLKTNMDVQGDQPVATELNPAVESAELETGTQVQTLERQDVEQGFTDGDGVQEPTIEFSETSTPKSDAKTRKRRKTGKEKSETFGPEPQLDSVGLSDVQPQVEENANQVDSLRELEGKLEELSRDVEQAGELIAQSNDVAEELIDSTQQIADENLISEPPSVESDNALADSEQSEDQIQALADQIIQDQPVENQPIIHRPAPEFDAALENELALQAALETPTVINEPESIEQNVQATEVTETLEPQTQPNLGSEMKTAREIPQPLAKTKPSANYSRLLAAHHDRGGKIAEEYRALRTNLLSKYSDDRFCFMVTSAQAGEGKTVTCLNLGFIMAERLDRRTIVVDYNLRDGKMAQLLGAKQGPGIADVLLGTATLNEVIQPTIYPNLFFITAGNVSPDRAGELLSRSIAKDIVHQLKEEYEYVLLDTPAANTYSDAGITGLVANDALLVVRMNKTPREEVERAILSLQATNVNIVGMLLTHRKPRWFS